MISSALLATAVCVFLLLPGIAFLRTLGGSNYGPVHANNFYNYLTWGLLISAIFYLLAFLLPCSPDLKNISCWLAGEEEFSESIQGDLFRLLILSVSTTLLAGCLGILVGLIIVWFRLDILIPRLQFKNDWYYIFSGRGTVKNYKKHITIIEFLYEVGSSVVIYRGTILDRYKFDAESFKYVYLTNVQRTSISQWQAPIKPDKRSEDDVRKLNSEPSFYSVSNIEPMVFKIEDMKNIRVIYRANQTMAEEEKPNIAE